MAVVVLGYWARNSASETGSESINVPAGTDGFALFVGGFLSGADTAFDRDTPTLSIGGLDPKFRAFIRNGGNSTENDVAVYAGSVFPSTWGSSITFSWTYSSSITNGYMFCLVFLSGGGGYNTSTIGQSGNTGNVGYYDNTSNIVMSGYYGTAFNGSDTTWIAGVVSNTAPSVILNDQQHLVTIGPAAKGGGKYMTVFYKQIQSSPAFAYVHAANLSYPGCAAVRFPSVVERCAWLTA